MTGGLDDEALDAVMREPIVARLGTTDDAGYPYVVPIWTEWDGHRVWIVARAKATFVGHLAVRPKVALWVVRADEANTRVLIRGRARIVGEPGPLAGQVEAIARRMARRYEGDVGERYLQESRDWWRVLVEITPDHVQSWGEPGWHPKYR